MTLKGHKLVEKEIIHPITKKPVVDTAKLPKEDVECPKCGNGKAYTWYVEIPMEESTETQMYECTKCRHRWRADQDTTGY